MPAQLAMNVIAAALDVLPDGPVRNELSALADGLPFEAGAQHTLVELAPERHLTQDAERGFRGGEDLGVGWIFDQEEPLEEVLNECAQGEERQRWSLRGSVR